MKKTSGYKNCDLEDSDPFNGCKPVNCEEKYFGQRNFYNGTACVPAANCDEEDSQYDYDTNECECLEEILSDDDLFQIKSGNFSNWVDEKLPKVNSKDLEVRIFGV